MNTTKAVVTCVHGFATGLLLLALLWTSADLTRAKEELRRLNANTRLTRDVLYSMDAEERVALKGSVLQAVHHLDQYDFVSDNRELGSPYLAGILNDARQRTVRNTMEYLRAETGEDLGNDPEKWIETLKGNSPGREAN